MGQRTPSHQKSVQGVPAHGLIIGGLSISAIAWAMGGNALSIGRIKPTNAFCIRVENQSRVPAPFLLDFYYVYVKITYSG